MWKPGATSTSTRTDTVVPGAAPSGVTSVAVTFASPSANAGDAAAARKASSGTARRAQSFMRGLVRRPGRPGDGVADLVGQPEALGELIGLGAGHRRRVVRRGFERLHVRALERRDAEPPECQADDEEARGDAHRELREREMPARGLLLGAGV